MYGEQQEYIPLSVHPQFTAYILQEQNLLASNQLAKLCLKGLEDQGKTAEQEKQTLRQQLQDTKTEKLILKQQMLQVPCCLLICFDAMFVLLCHHGSLTPSCSNA